MILSDRDIRAAIAVGRVRLTPFDDRAVQSSSLDVRLGAEFRVFANNRSPYIDVRQPSEDLTEVVEASEAEPFILHPGEFVLASTLEEVGLPDDLVARLEGKSSLGRLGLLIHSSLPGDESVLFWETGGSPRPRPIREIVDKSLSGWVVAFDRQTLRVDYRELTGWYRGPADRIFEIVLSTGRRVRVTAAHTLFSLDEHGEVTKVRTGDLDSGDLVAVPAHVPTSQEPETEIDCLALAPESAYEELVLQGPFVDAAFAHEPQEVIAALADAGIAHHRFYRARSRLPLSVALQLSRAGAGLSSDDARLGLRGSPTTLPLKLTVDREMAWLLGLYLAEGYRRRNQVVVSNTDQEILDRAQSVLDRLEPRVYRAPGSLTCCSTLLASLLDWFGFVDGSRSARIPGGVFGWPAPLQAAFLDGYIDGDGSRGSTRISMWTASHELADDVLLLLMMRGRRASVCSRERGGRPAYQVSVPHREHKTLADAPLPRQLLRTLRREAGLTQSEVAKLQGLRGATGVSNIETGSGRAAVRRTTLRRICAAYERAGETSSALDRLDAVANGDVMWDKVVAVRDTGRTEPVYDLEVRPGGKPIENFVAGTGGVFVSNTAGFVDAGFQGHLTLELSNVMNLPITLYPGMKIGQLAFFQLSSPAEHPYGSAELGSKYQGQRGPTASRYYENFDD